MGAPAAGALNRRIEILRASEASDGAGGKTLTWSRLAWVRASAATLRRIGADVSDVAVKQQAYKLEMRPTDVTKKDRIRMNGVEHVIRSLYDPDGNRRKIVLEIEEVGAAS